MALDRIDAAAIVGFVALIAASTVLEGVLVAAALGGFALSLASWRLYGGRPWEALAWLAWVGAAVSIVVVPGGAPFVVAFFGCLLGGLGLLLAARLEWLPSIWDATEPAEVDERAD
ncbi:hypothetical protein [Natronolimnohabitans innermongolicus]|uniref:Uncharacterized protein n=1 Tax=Natronolimnohabitans innermongolicus JCM 12255 TaxID=1227499 RepID=L9XBD5_9EURY|nr:hypothetical protein [Natronolimnohabitans innermongolicus]ELY59039.1 hypothetical protein C493_05295 [Natronolimnohabitans innermongolicus JCM 12255]